MERQSLTGLPVLVVGSALACDKIKSFLLLGDEQQTFMPSTRVIDTSDYGEALQILSEGDTEFAAIITAMDEISPAALRLVEEISRRECGPVIVMTDNREVVMTMRTQGYIFFLPQQNLNGSTLGNTIYAAWEHDHLQDKHEDTSASQQHAEQRFKDMAEHFADWLWEVDKDLKIIFSSSRKRPTEEGEQKSNFLNCFLPDERNRMEEDFAQLAKEPKPFYDREYWSFDNYGTRVCWSISGVPVFTQTGEFAGYRGIGRDISLQKASADQLYYLANHDPLTGLYNRGRFCEELSRFMRLSRRSEREGAIVLVDIDHYKYINETHGHEVGDKLLTHFAQILRDNLRSGDMIARMGGNEFGILLPELRASDIEYRMNSLMDAVNRKPLTIAQGNEISFAISAGVTRFPLDGHTADELLSKANVALKEAKEKGRSRYAIFDGSQMQQQNMSRTLEGLDLVNACLQEESERMVLHYQPIVSLNGGKKNEFYEVLVRMIDDDGELVAPIKFIEVAEQFGLIGQIDRVVTERALKMLKAWHKTGRKVHLSVNISGKTFDDDDALEAIAKALDEHKLPEGAVVFEITETAVLRDMARVRRVIADFKRRGAHFALDDCGAGYSSFNYIRHLDLDYIKIDGTFIRNLHKNDDDDAFVKALRDVARKMKILTVAEMVENEQTAEKLKQLGVDFAQGYFYSVPMPTIPEDDTVH